MKRRRLVYVTEHYGRIDSDDTRLTHGAGLLAVAMHFGEIAARREYGETGVVVDLEQGERHRLPPGIRKYRPARERLDITGDTDYHVLIGRPMGCGLLECQVIVIPIRITRARGDREYYDA